MGKKTDREFLPTKTESFMRVHFKMMLNKDSAP